MAFVTHEQGIERTCALVEGERGEAATHLQLLVAARLLAAEVRRLRATQLPEARANARLTSEVARLRTAQGETLQIVTGWLEENGIVHEQLLVRLGTSGLLGQAVD